MSNLSQKTRTGILALAVAAGCALTAGRSVDAAVIMDQIGTVPSLVTGQTAYLSSNFTAAADTTASTATVDDFSVAGPSLLTKVFAVTDGYFGFTDYSIVKSWDVEIYSSLAAANSSLVGDVYNHVFSTSAVNLTTPFGGSSTSALFNVSTAITLPSAGTYYLAVVANLTNESNGVVGIYGTTGVAGSNPGNLNAYQENPGGGLGFTGNSSAINGDAAYAIQGVTTAVPEPTTALSMALVSTVMGLSRRKRISRA